MSTFRLTLTVDPERAPLELGTFPTPAEARDAARSDSTRAEIWDGVPELPDGRWELYQRREGEPRSWTKWLFPDAPRSQAYYTIKEVWGE